MSLCSYYYRATGDRSRIFASYWVTKVIQDKGVQSIIVTSFHYKEANLYNLSSVPPIVHTRTISCHTPLFITLVRARKHSRDSRLMHATSTEYKV